MTTIILSSQFYSGLNNLSNIATSYIGSLKMTDIVIVRHTSFYRMVQSMFRYLEPSVTDRWSDMLVANTALTTLRSQLSYDRDDTKTYVRMK